MPKPKLHNIVPNPKGGWDVKKSGTKRACKHNDTKQDADKAGRKLSKNQNTECIMHKKDGCINRRDSHGNHPYSLKS